MIILAIDTCASLAGIAILSDSGVLAESIFSCSRTLSARLMPEIDHQLNLAGLAVTDIDLFAAATGPGSFTGVRCGVATIQGLALATGKPCAGFSSLAMLAMNCARTPYPVCALLDARKQEVYAGLYDCSGPTPTALLTDWVAPLENMIERIRSHTSERIVFLGEGAQRYQAAITEQMGNLALITPHSAHTGRPANGALLALHNHRNAPLSSPALLLPDYIRPSDAELARNAAAHSSATTLS